MTEQTLKDEKPVTKNIYGIWMDEDLYNQIIDFCKQTGISQSKLFRDAIREKMKREKE